MKKNPIPKYNHKSIERKWQKKWQEEKIYQPDMDHAKKPFYNLMMFPYPSAEGLHVGNMYAFTGADVYGRFKRLEGYDVFEPIGLDGFGIHSENFAMNIGEHIKNVSKRSEKNFYRQLHEIGNMYDWSRTVETYKPNYYKWTQWLFLQMYKNGLAYQKVAKVNWCPSCKTVLSNEQVIQGQCERCDSVVEKKELKQWFFSITKYAEKLLRNLKWIDWPEDVKFNQKNWIGKSEGATIKFKVKSEKVKVLAKKSTHYSLPTTHSVDVFTTRPDTLFGATFMVLSPEHSLISAFRFQISNWSEVKRYIEKAKNKSDQDRLDVKKAKTGVELKGIKAINPATKEEIPVWIADYVLSDYGTSATMAVPAHDERDFEFAKKYNLPIKEVVQSSKFKVQNHSSKLKISKSEKQNKSDCFSGEGVTVNSEFLNDLKTAEAKKEITKWLAKTKNGKKSVDYKLRDWCISRQRYWGPPIPIVWCHGKCKVKSAKLKVKVLMVHAFEGHKNSNWFPFVRRELENLGCKVFAPTMSTSKNPTVKSWVKELTPYIKKLDEDSIIICHSLGSKAIMHALNKNDKKVGKVFLVASALGSQKKDWDWFHKEWPSSDIDSLKKFWKEKVNWKDADSKIKQTHIILSKDDPYIAVRHYKDIKIKNVILQKWDKQKHFQQKKNPKLLNYIIENILNDIEPVPVPVPEEDLPVKLPPMKDYLPEGKGKGPLAKNEKFVNVRCPQCGGPAKRETDVSDPFVDSSWYFFRYPSTEFEDKPFDKRRTKKWLPVDSYIGGKEHTVLHLLYSRFITMVLNDLGHINFDEPYKRFFGHGLIAKDGVKMSKSKNNIISPDEMIEKYGADTMRLYLRFLGDFSQGGDWRDSGIEGMSRFVKRLWKTFHELEGCGKGVKNISMIDPSSAKALEGKAKLLDMSMVDKTIKVIGEDIEKLSFNTAVARLMEFINWIKENKSDFNKAQAKKIRETLAFMLAPMAPHIAEEFWTALNVEVRPNRSLAPRRRKISANGSIEDRPQHGGAVFVGSIFNQKWPEYDPKNIVDEQIEIVVQVNGKIRDKLMVAKDVAENEVKTIALESEKVKKYVDNKKIKKVIYVPGRLVSVVV